MADTNVDLMKAQVPAWFQQLTGWESRLVVRVCACAWAWACEGDVAVDGTRMRVHAHMLTVGPAGFQG